MAHPDNSWRVGAIYRACVRYAMDEETAVQHMRTMGLTRGEKNSLENCARIWFRTMDRRRENYLLSLIPKL